MSAEATSILFIYEFGPRPDDRMMAGLIDELSARNPRLRAHYFHGLASHYRAGGLQPHRLLNLVYMFLALPWKLLAVRPDHIFVRTTPPGIQLWAAALGSAANIPVSCWLMDYHPEIEIRRLNKRRWLRPISAILSGIDRSLLRRFRFFVVLDAAMEDLVRRRAPRSRVIVHPTWGGTGLTRYDPVAIEVLGKRSRLSLVYAGNLGEAHPLETLERLLFRLSSIRAVQVFAVGVSPDGARRFNRMALRLGISLKTRARLSFDGLKDFYEAERVDLGVVLQSDETAGCVSPSKFGGYIAFGLPMIYIGPGGTNAHVVCRRFGAGFHLPNDVPDSALRSIARSIADPAHIQQSAKRVQDAAEYFGSRNARSLAGILHYEMGATA